MGSIHRPEDPNVQDLEPMLPSELGLRAHCRRVASLAIEVAARLRLPPADQLTVERCAWLHHYPYELFEPQAFDRLMTDLAGANWARDAGEQRQNLPPQLKAVLQALQVPIGEKAEDRAELMAQIIQVANAFDEQLELLPHEHRTLDQIIDELRWMAQDGIYDPAVVAALASLPRTRKDAVIEVVYQLPVFPAVALKALALAPEDELGFQQLETLASSDQVLADHVITLANSSLYSPHQRISTVRQALAYVGLEAARKLLMAAVLEPLFGSSGLRDLGKHSLEMAELSERIATLGASFDSGEAFLAGLVHDVGRLALHRISGEAGASYLRFIERGCEPVFAEMVLCRFDHAGAGAEVLRSWNFSESLIEGVENHHQPERSDSKLASLLYLAEFWSASHEDLPSQIRLHRALEVTGISIEQLSALTSTMGVLNCLIHAI